MAKVMISMPDELLKELDQAAKERHKRRSELLKDLALQFLRGEKMPPALSSSTAPTPLSDQEKKKKALEIMDLFKTDDSDVSERHDDYLAEIYSK